jgi:hypothetical protein
MLLVSFALMKLFKSVDLGSPTTKCPRSSQLKDLPIGSNLINETISRRATNTNIDYAAQKKDVGA